ncbi:YfhO family protein [Haoranjiania flava]|uniref:YfhO family protein n=1 Tax=Haoranjiania flava TaxID=1856322 RepID=A0AAE3IPX3_9BACT|nr:YfhO family protein [Haoranjiania flava]MCU7694971.1 YfhO family protein [Haoranjiania flava]
MFKNFDWKRDVLPHAIAIAVFLILAVIFCYPALSGQVLSQPDIIHWKGMAQDAFNYKAQHGHFPLWNTHLFSGTPNYQTAVLSAEFIPDFVKMLTLGLPNPASFFFLASVCFYILTVVFKFNNIIRILTSIAFAYCTYNPVISVAGHETKFLAIALMPALLAGILLLFKRKYIIGFAVTAFFATLEMRANHIQITYYLLLVILVMTVAYIIHWIQTGQYKHMILALGLSLVAGGIGIGNMATVLLSTAEYAKYTMRGGKALEINRETGAAKEIAHTKGLDNSYAFMWSMYKTEPLQMMMPAAFGGSSSNTFAENEKFAEKLSNTGIPPQGVSQLTQMLPQYWGGLESTSGPVYIGTIIALLALIGFVVARKHRWWILAATALGIILSWGKYFGLNDTLFNLLPLYNKFRAPSMALVIPQLLLPLMAGISLQTLFFNKETDARAFIQKNFKTISYTLGATVLFLLLVYLVNDYSSMLDDQLRQMFANPQAGGEALGSAVINALKSERKAMFFSGILRVVLFSALILGVLYLFMKDKLKASVLLILLTLTNTIDLVAAGKKYMGAENFMTPEDLETQAFAPKPYDQQILQDKDPHFRILNLANGDPFQDAITSYHHRSIGGYHPAKLSIYQDLIQGQLSTAINPGVLNMLDTKYIVGQDGNIITNPEALGAAWFVKHVQFVPNAAAEMNALNKFNPADTAFVQESFKAATGAAPAFDSGATIQLSSYSNDEIRYKTSAKTNQFAVLSEVYYPAGWNAYIDGKKTDYVKVNYVLRGIAVPAGEHEILFKFEPQSIKTGNMLVVICNVLLLLVMAAAVVYIFLRQKKQSANPV